MAKKSLNGLSPMVWYIGPWITRTTLPIASYCLMPGCRLHSLDQSTGFESRRGITIASHVGTGRSRRSPMWTDPVTPTM